MKFYYLLFLVILSVWFEPGRCCGDNYDRCPGWKKYCSTNEFVKTNCQKSCNLCKTGFCTGSSLLDETLNRTGILRKILDYCVYYVTVDKGLNCGKFPLSRAVSYQESASNAGNGLRRPERGTACVPFQGKICHYDEGRWGKSWCMTEDNWGAECVQCSAPEPRPSQPGECGVENEIDGRISGGSETEANQYPWMVQLPMNCGGSLITDRHVLTAKHCVEAGNKNWRGRMVKFGVHNINDRSDYQEVAIKDYVMPDASEIGAHDIAIIILEKPVDLSDNKIGTVCLPANNRKDYKGKRATAMGWGMTTVGSWLSPVLKHVSLKVSQYERRNFLYTEIPLVNGVPQDPCAGDSGGPLVYKEESGRWTIVGTVYGGGYDCRTGRTNGEGKWNKVTDHLAWIKEVIGKE